MSDNIAPNTFPSLTGNDFDLDFNFDFNAFVDVGTFGDETQPEFDFSTLPLNVDLDANSVWDSTPNLPSADGTGHINLFDSFMTGFPVVSPGLPRLGSDTIDDFSVAANLAGPVNHTPAFTNGDPAGDASIQPLQPRDHSATASGTCTTLVQEG
jgi:hypothetical protein